MTDLPEWPKDDSFPDRETATAYAKQATSKRLFPSITQQQIVLSQAWLFPHECPNCLTPMAVVDAIHHGGDSFECSACHALLLFTVPLVQVGPVYWEWRIAPKQIGAVT